MFQLILSPIRDWNNWKPNQNLNQIKFQLILSPIRDWNIIDEAAFHPDLPGSN